MRVTSCATSVAILIEHAGIILRKIPMLDFMTHTFEFSWNLPGAFIMAGSIRADLRAANDVYNTYHIQTHHLLENSLCFSTHWDEN